MAAVETNALSQRNAAHAVTLWRRDEDPRVVRVISEETVRRSGPSGTHTHLLLLTPLSPLRHKRSATSGCAECARKELRLVFAPAALQVRMEPPSLRRVLFCFFHFVDANNNLPSSSNCNINHKHLVFLVLETSNDYCLSALGFGTRLFFFSHLASKKLLRTLLRRGTTTSSIDWWNFLRTFSSVGRQYSNLHS